MHVVKSVLDHVVDVGGVVGHWQLRELHYALINDCERTMLTVMGLALRVKIPAKKWGDTEIAERGRSVPVMRARYRSAGLIPHQRGWTDAG